MVLEKNVEKIFCCRCVFFFSNSLSFTAERRVRASSGQPQSQNSLILLLGLSFYSLCRLTYRSTGVETPVLETPVLETRSDSVFPR